MPNYIIQNNSFTLDIREVRKSRLSLLSQNIANYVSELSLPNQEFVWGKNAYDIYSTLLDLQNQETLKKNELSKLSIENDNVLFERYVVLKSLIMNKLEGDSELQKKFGVNEPIPNNRIEKYDKIKKLIEANDELIKSGNESILPMVMIENLKKLLTNSQYIYSQLETQRIQSIELTSKLNNLHDEDSIRLRNLYKWAVAFWGKRDLNLVNMGFAPMRNVKLSVLVKSIELSFKEDIRVLTWNKINGIDKYQVALKENDSSNNWIELHNDVMNYCTLNGYHGDLIIKLRIHNKHGYSDWSKPFEINVESKD